MRISTKGQVTIPIEIRTKLGLFPNTEVTFVVKDNMAVLQKQLKTNSRGRKLIKQLSGRASVRMSTDDIMKLTRS
jgi:AbrB family looped-hinge helix DNA binding protein